MFADVVDLREFYTGRLGQVARRMLVRRIRAFFDLMPPSRRYTGVRAEQGRRSGAA